MLSGISYKLNKGADHCRKNIHNLLTLAMFFSVIIMVMPKQYAVPSQSIKTPKTASIQNVKFSVTWQHKHVYLQVKPSKTFSTLRKKTVRFSMGPRAIFCIFYLITVTFHLQYYYEMILPCDNSNCMCIRSTFICLKFWTTGGKCQYKISKCSHIVHCFYSWCA